MAFVADTQILTDSGWKPIESIAGRDKVLVRNFAGDAEFIQPFALRKRKYDGQIISLVGRWWSVGITPEHRIVYLLKGSEKKERARDYTIDKHKFIWRKFRYITPEYPMKESFVTNRRTHSQRFIEDEDWYTLVAYVIRRGEISKHGRGFRLLLHLNNSKPEEELKEIGTLLTRMGVEWNLTTSGGRQAILVSATNNLATKLKSYLGNRKRADMYLPDKMVFNSSRPNARTLIDTLIRASQATIRDKSIYQWSSSNKRLIDTLEIIGAFAGYTISHRLARPAGRKLPKGFSKRDSYNVYIRNSMSMTSPTDKEAINYSGFVYQVDIFDGQVFIKQGDGLPIWMNPK